MDIALGFLTFGTLGFVTVFAYVSARMAAKHAAEGGQKSALSRDGAADFRARSA